MTAYSTLNGLELSRRIGLTVPDLPVGSGAWAPNTQATAPFVSMDEVATHLRTQQHSSMMPPSTATKAVVYCTPAEEGERPKGVIPEIYAQAALKMGLPVEHLQEAFGEQGFRVDKCFSAWKRGQDVLEVWKVDLFVSPKEPLFKIYFRRHKTSKLLLPDLYLQPLTHPMAVDCFANYQWPNGDRELLETRHTCCVVGVFRNAREPVLFVCDNEQRRAQLVTLLAVVTELAKLEHQARRDSYVCRELPKHIGRQGDPDCQTESSFPEKLQDACIRLGTSAACAQYWRHSRRTWVLQWNGSKYVKKRFYITVHRSQPVLIFCKKDSQKKDCFALHLDYWAHSSSRVCNNVDQKKSWSSFMKSDRLSPHLTFVDNMRDEVPRTFFSFETAEDLKDFQQVLATLSYLTEREAKSVYLNQMILETYSPASDGETDEPAMVPNTLDEAPDLSRAQYYEPPSIFQAMKGSDNNVVNAEGIRMVPRTRKTRGQLFAPNKRKDSYEQFLVATGELAQQSSSSSADLRKPDVTNLTLGNSSVPRPDNAFYARTSLLNEALSSDDSF